MTKLCVIGYSNRNAQHAMKAEVNKFRDL